MPNHPERVRRNYITHEVGLREDLCSNSFVLDMHITKELIASWPSYQSVRHHLLQHLDQLMRKMYDREIY